MCPEQYPLRPANFLSACMHPSVSLPSSCARTNQHAFSDQQMKKRASHHSYPTSLHPPLRNGEMVVEVLAERMLQYIHTYPCPLPSTYEHYSFTTMMSFLH